MHIVVIILRVILWLLLGALALVLLTPVGAEFGYEGGVLRVSAKVWGLRLQLFPRPPGPEKPEKEKKPKEKPAEQTQETKPKKQLSLPFERDELFELLLRLLRMLLRGFGRFGRRFRIDRFRLVYLAAGCDPYTVAMSYGYLNAALYSLAPLCARRFSVRDCEVRTAIDFTEDWPQLELALAFSIRIGQLIGTGLSLVCGALGIVLPALVKKKLAARRQPPAGAEEAPGQSESTDDQQTQEPATETTDEEEHHG